MNIKNRPSILIFFHSAIKKIDFNFDSSFFSFEINGGCLEIDFCFQFSVLEGNLENGQTPHRPIILKNSSYLPPVQLIGSLHNFI